MPVRHVRGQARANIAMKQRFGRRFREIHAQNRAIFHASGPRRFPVEISLCLLDNCELLGRSGVEIRPLSWGRRFTTIANQVVRVPVALVQPLLSCTGSTAIGNKALALLFPPFRPAASHLHQNQGSAVAIYRAAKLHNCIWSRKPKWLR